MGFHRGTWHWEAVALKGAVLSRKNGLRIADLEDIGISVFRVKSCTPQAALSVIRDGHVADHNYGLVVSRGALELYPMTSISNLRFTRRQSGAIGGPIADEEILIRYTWEPTGKKLRVHIRPSQVLVSEDVG